MKYDLFLSDFDGTLVRADGTVSEKNKRAIDVYRNAGGVFAVCSGRMLPSALPRARELYSEGLVAAIQGSIIADVATGKILRCNAFERADALAAVELCERMGWHTHVYTEDKFYSNRDDLFLKIYEKICRVKAELPDVSLTTLLSSLTSVVKIIILTEEEKRDAIYETCKRELGEKFYVTCSATWEVEILPAGQNKGKALDFFCEYYHIPAERAAAIGDALNDKEMLERAGGKFAVGNAEQALKEIAVTVSSNEDDGVAEAIKYAMEERL